MPYEYLRRPELGARIHFRHAEPDDDPAKYISPDLLAEMRIGLAYVDAAVSRETEALNSLGVQLDTRHRPYDPNPPAGMKGWYSFMDDLCDLSEDRGGMVIVVDNAGGLFAEPTSWGFELITVWVLQLPGWQARKLPCHLIFQMSTDPAVAEIYRARR
jgi:hypothetical protein